MFYKINKRNPEHLYLKKIGIKYNILISFY